MAKRLWRRRVRTGPIVWRKDPYHSFLDGYIATVEMHWYDPEGTSIEYGVINLTLNRKYWHE